MNGVNSQSYLLIGVRLGTRREIAIGAEHVLGFPDADAGHISSDVIARPEQIEDRRDKIALSRLEWKIEFPSLHRLAEILDEAVENLLNVKKRCWPTFLGETHDGPLGGPPIKRDNEIGRASGRERVGE